MRSLLMLPILINSVFMFSRDFCVSVVTTNSDNVTYKKSQTVCFLCPFCGKVFSDWNKLHKQHIHLHNHPVICKICGKVQEDMFAYSEHKKNCKYTCKNCGKQFINVDRFNIHMRVHK